MKANASILKYVLLFSLMILGSNVDASTTTEDADVLTEKQMQRLDKQEDRLHKKINKLQNKLAKAKKKAGVSMEEDDFLENADDRVRFGLIGVLGGILLSVILTTALKFIGIIALSAGIALLIWYLIDP